MGTLVCLDAEIHPRKEKLADVTHKWLIWSQSTDQRIEEEAASGILVTQAGT